MKPPPPSAILCSLETIGRAEPTARKILVAATLIWGREVLRSLARATGGWIGWEPVTLRSLADDLALVALSESGTRTGTDIEIGVLIGTALDDAIASGDVPTSWPPLASNDGFRTAIRDGVLELRMAGISAEQLAGAHTTDSVAGVVAVLHRYATLLGTHHLADPAAVFAAALDAFEAESPFVLDQHVLLAPDLENRGLPGRLLQRIIDRGARALDSATAIVSAHETTLFAAATPSDEVREALRRAIAEGYRLDEIELVTTDPDTYGTALDALCQHLGSHATLQEGLPFQRSRIGRAIARMLDWLEEGLPAHLLREALEAGDIAAPTPPGGSAIDGAILANAMRTLRIGWGRERYETAMASLTNGTWLASETEHHAARQEPGDRPRPASPADIAAQLAALLQTILAVLPSVPERGVASAVPVTSASLANVALRFLDLMPLAEPGDEFNAGRLRERLDQLAAVDQLPQSFGAALGELRELLGDFRVWTDLDPAGQVRLSRSGAVHLADIRHAGVTGRPRVFFLGCDDDRTAGPRTPDPLLPDAFRERFPDLVTAAQRRAERRETLDRAVAEPTGSITISFALAADKGRTAGPAPLLLDLARHIWHTPALDYSTLQQQLGAPACAVPALDASPLDERDVWLGALGAGAALLDGAATIRGKHAGLDAGVAALDTLDDQSVTPCHGLVVAAAGRYDPTTDGARAVSASALELLSKCPLAWFYRYALHIKPPDDPEYDPETWLDPMQRGSLLHAVFEEFVNSYRDRADLLPTAEAALDATAICDQELARQRAIAPPPSESIFLAERDEIHRAARSFLEMEREIFRRTGRVSWLETEFELKGDDAIVKLPDGSAFRLRGFIDRIDALGDGARLIVDYKTGNGYRFARDRKGGPLNGGRLLQPALYSAAYAAMSGTKVERFEYRFPTAKGKNEILPHHAADLAMGEQVVVGVLTPLRSGAFLPTIDAEDCKYCDFRSICHVSGGESFRDPVRSPRADWANRMPGSEPHLVQMRARRAKPGAPA